MEKNGQWRSIVPPFLCGNYLIEVNVPVAKTGKVDEKIISITDIATGKEIGEKPIVYWPFRRPSYLCLRLNLNDL